MSHRNARLTPHGRLLLCERVEHDGWKLIEAAAAAGVSRQTAGKWLARWRSEGAAGLLDRSSRPLRIALRVVGRLLRRVVLLRLTKRRGPAWIAWHTELAPATVYRALRRRGLHRLRALEPREPVVRYCWPAAGDHTSRHRLGLRPRGRRRRHPARLCRGAR
jgi:transposase